MEKISKNFYKGDPVDTFYEIHLAATQGKSLYHSNIKLKPAAFFFVNASKSDLQNDKRTAFV